MYTGGAKVVRIKFKVAVVMLVISAALVEKSAGTTYVVGDALGWSIPTAGAASYSSWAAQHTFFPGDTLVFNFTTGAHDVARVDKAGYDSCSATTPSTSLSVSPASVTLNSAGPKYFICTFGQHCSFGQKLAIKVSAASTPPLQLPISPPAPSPMSIPTATPVALAPAPAPISTQTMPSSGGPPAPVVPEAPLSPLSEGVPGPDNGFPGIGTGAGSSPFPQTNSAAHSAASTLFCMILSLAIVVVIC